MLYEDEKAVTLHLVRSDGKTFDIGTGTPWRIPNDGIQDWNTYAFNVQTNANVISDGSTLVSTRVDEKDRTVTAVYTGRECAKARQEAVLFFNPKFKFEVQLTYHGRTFSASGVQYAFDAPTVNIYSKPTFTWTLLCLDPYLKSVDNNDCPFGAANPMIGFPYVSHWADDPNRQKNFPAGAPASELIYDGANTIYNQGDVPCYYRVVVKAEGKLVNPTIWKDSKKVRVETTMKMGDTLIIDFEQAPPSVTLNGTNAIQLCTRDSNFTGMIMQTGANVFTFKLDNSENATLADVRILFNKRYLAV
jgi:hypothetical protein